MNSEDVKYMKMALKLAERGRGSVEPNPLVGCVITKANQTAGKGWHRKFGGPHAEINALEDCKNLGIDPAGGTMYVSLEPCCHEGKTGPCTEAIISAGVSRVVVAAIDPSEHAKGKGIEQLRQAGIEVKIGVCEAEAKLLNAPFFKFVSTGKSWVILKWAQSIDGKLAYADTTEKRWISSEQSRTDAQVSRRRADAILVGINTVIADDPLLTARPARAIPPLRVVFDSDLRIPLDCELLKTADKAPVLIYTRQGTVDANPEKADAIQKTGAEIICYGDTAGKSNLHFLLEQLARRGCQQLLVEGGGKVIGSFLKENLADEIVVYIAPKILGGAGNIGITESITELADSLELQNVEAKPIEGDVRLSGLTKKAINEIKNRAGTEYEKDRDTGTGEHTANQSGRQSGTDYHQGL
jgi:diaminohydroxyphosphoribosylaminopyrimidine deaminase/5-amino-6-(5-phosphoribosylamino)uracil reductase